MASWVTLPVASWVMELVFIVQCGQEGSLSVFLRLRASHVPKKKTLSDLSWRQEVAAPFFSDGLGSSVSLGQEGKAS